MLLPYIFQISLLLFCGSACAQKPPRTGTTSPTPAPSPVGNSPQPVFVENLDIFDDADTYRSFIQRIRDQVRDERGYNARGVPALIPQAPAGSRNVPFFDINISGGDNGVISLRIRRDNLYVIGWRNETFLQWYEFVERANSPRLIPNARPIVFPSQYVHIERLAGEGREQIDLGQGALRGAVSALAGAETAQPMARPMLVLIQMISEASRMTAVFDPIYNNYISGMRPSAFVTGFENGWRSLCAELIHQDQDQTFNPANPPARRFRTAVENLGPETVEELARSLALVLRQHTGESGPGPSGKRRRSVQRREISKRQDSEITDLINEIDNPLKPRLILPGRPLVQIFRLEVTSINGGPQSVHGTVIVQDCLDVYPLYGRPVRNAQQITPGSNLEIGNILRIPNAADDWSMLIQISNREMDLAGDGNVLSDEFRWSDTPGYQNRYGELHTRNLQGAHGKGKLVYTVMKNAAEALVDVILINGDGEDPAQVFGTIKGTISKFPKQEITLFDTPSDQSIDVNPGKQIPLRSRAVAVPMNASLKLTLDLSDYDTVSSNDQIVKTSTTWL